MNSPLHRIPEPSPLFDIATAPDSPKAEHRPEGSPPTPRNELGRGHLILVVDDDPSVRLLTKLTLESLGFRAALASDGTEAIAIFAECSMDIAAVLTDMRMPMVDGKGTIQVLLKMNPQLPIIGMSGISGLGSAREAGVEARFFLPKPFSAEQLLQVLNEALARPVPSLSEPPRCAA